MNVDPSAAAACASLPPQLTTTAIATTYLEYLALVFLESQGAVDGSLQLRTAPPNYSFDLEHTACC